MASFNNTDRIDAYLSGQMTDQEKARFEEELLDTSSSSSKGTLKEETELQADIIRAIREQQLRKHLREEELVAQMEGKIAAMSTVGALAMEEIPDSRLKTYRKRKPAADQRKKRVPEKRPLPQTRKSQRKVSAHNTARRWKIAGISLSSVAVAAICLCIILIPTMRTMQQISTQFAQSINIEPMRGAMLDPVETQLEQTYQYIASEHWSDAAPIARSLMEQTATPVSELCQEECQEIHEQAQWLYTLCEMHRGHVFRAKHLLRQIAADGGLYAPQAKQYLDQL